MISVYKKLSHENKQLILRLILCTIIATVFSLLIAEPYSPTAAVTANLFICTDRGYRGSVRFGTRRVLVHIIQGLLVMVLIFPCKYFELPIPDTLLIIVSCIFAILIGFPLNMKYSYSPVLSTLATATFIIACGSVRTFTRFPYRVMECVAGYAIGYLVYYVLVPPDDRYQRAKNLLMTCSQTLYKEGTSVAYRKSKKTLDSDLQFLEEDSEHGRKKYHHEQKELMFVRAFKRILEAVESYQDHLEHFRPEINPDYIEQLRAEFHGTWDYYLRFLQSFLDNNELNIDLSEPVPPPPNLKPSTNWEMLLTADIIDFRERLRTLMEIQNDTFSDVSSADK